MCVAHWPGVNPIHHAGVQDKSVFSNDVINNNNHVVFLPVLSSLSFVSIVTLAHVCGNSVSKPLCWLSLSYHCLSFVL